MLQVELLLRVHHKNLVGLVGYCEDGDKLALIYEFMENGDLDEHMSGNPISFLFKIIISTIIRNGILASKK